MALLKLFNSTPSILRAGIRDLNTQNVLKRFCHLSLTTTIPKGEEIPKYEICKDDNAWQYVERLLPCNRIPDIPVKKRYASGWTPPKLNENMPYFVRRSRNHMLPVYLICSHRGMKRVTVITHIHGDIRKLASDIQQFLEKVNKKIIGVKVLETCGRIDFHGDHVSNIKLWLEKRNN